jgi:wyosine [tRNA(Phe)-imidazoG37] synthetase (radical SAM superfamily)
MFIEANKYYASEIAAVAREISPDEVQIDTPLRPCAVRPLSPASIAKVQREFTNFESVVTVYEARRYKVLPLDLVETLRRRPKL